jgi:hypothetical protein
MITGLNVVRILRIVAGVGFILYGLLMYHYLLAFMGGIVLLFGILNIGCPFNSCSVTPMKNKKNIKEIEYEDLSK